MCTDDYNRVKLKEIPGVHGSDYINASFINVKFTSYSNEVSIYDIKVDIIYVRNV